MRANLHTLTAQGKGTLVMDGASGRRGEQFLNCYLVNDAGAIFIDLRNFGARAKSAEVVANFAKDCAAVVGQDKISGFTWAARWQDGTCNKP